MFFPHSHKPHKNTSVLVGTVLNGCYFSGMVHDYNGPYTMAAKPIKSLELQWFALMNLCGEWQLTKCDAMLMPVNK